jgi:methylglutaconyl-CoA hydratase
MFPGTEKWTTKPTIDPRGIATVTLNRPEKHNAFDDAVIAELREVFDSMATRDDVRLVVLASEGKNFSAGADLGWMKRMAEYDYDHNHRDAQALAGMLQALYSLPQPTIARVQGAAFGGAVGLVSCCELPQPTIARVQGAAFGGAVGLVSCCDMAVASESASFCLSEVKIGLIPATISPYVIRAMGERAARRYFTTAERFGANEAQRTVRCKRSAADRAGE